MANFDEYIDDDADGCDIDFGAHPLSDEELDLFILFAEALDPANDRTVDEVRAEWEELFDAPPT